MAGEVHKVDRSLFRATGAYGVNFPDVSDQRHAEDNRKIRRADVGLLVCSRFSYSCL